MDLQGTFILLKDHHLTLVYNPTYVDVAKADAVYWLNYVADSHVEFVCTKSRFAGSMPAPQVISLQPERDTAQIQLFEGE